MKKRFEVLDAFRGLCAISVVVFHMNLVGSLTETQFIRGSSIFVEFFFVLSGFVLAHGYAYRSHLNFVDLMASRFFRLYPLHIFMFFVIFLLEIGKFIAFKYGGYLFNSLPFTGACSLSEAIPNILLLQSWTRFSNPLSFNYPSWSISIEFYLYALFFCSVILLKNFKEIAWLALFTTALFLNGIESRLLTSSVLRGVPCFFGGAFTYWLFCKGIDKIKIQKPLGTFLESFSLLIVVACVRLRFKHYSLTLTVIFMVVVFLFALETGFISRILRLTFFQLLGKVSYSVYMCHSAVIFFVTSVAVIIQKKFGWSCAPIVDGSRTLDFGGPAINNAVIFVTCLIIVGISIVTYNFIEVPGQKLNPRNRGLVKK
jgi:peptidoglycan/LPS O-acetylase OafA/YrhL